MATTTTHHSSSHKRRREQKVPAKSPVPANSPMTLTTSTMTFIPGDIIVEILSWLPAKSLLRLRWACKYWFDLITRDSDFIKLHLLRSSTSTIEHPASVLSHSNKVNKTYYLSRMYYFNRSSLFTQRQVRIPHPFKSDAGFVCLGSCNGLLLCTSDDHKKLCIWNPCTQEYRILPDPPLTEFMTMGYGFEYDHTLDDYRVIRNISSLKDAEDDVQVYALGTNSWRSIRRNAWRSIGCNNNPYRHTYSSAGKFANGCLYWIDIKKIISFDIGKEKYQEESIEQFFHVKLRYMELQVFEGSLCLVQTILDRHENRHMGYFVQIWVMENKGTTNESSRTSWTQLFTTPVSLGGDHYPIKPLIRFSKSGEILLLKSQLDDLVLYDPNSNIFNEIRIRMGNRYLLGEVYIESLVSLNSGTYVGQNKHRKRRL